MFGEESWDWPEYIAFLLFSFCILAFCGWHISLFLIPLWNNLHPYGGLLQDDIRFFYGFTLSAQHSALKFIMALFSFNIDRYQIQYASQHTQAQQSERPALVSTRIWKTVYLAFI